MEKPKSVYTFSIIVIIFYALYSLFYIWALINTFSIEISNSYNYYIFTPILLVGLISGIVLLSAKKIHVISYAFTGIVLPVMISLFSNIVGRNFNLVLGFTDIPFLILFAIFGTLVKSFKIYLNSLKEKKEL